MDGHRQPKDHAPQDCKSSPLPGILEKSIKFLKAGRKGVGSCNISAEHFFRNHTGIIVQQPEADSVWRNGHHLLANPEGTALCRVMEPSPVMLAWECQLFLDGIMRMESTQKIQGPEGGRCG